MLKTYSYRLYPTKSQEQLLLQHFGSNRFVYNWALQARIEHYKNTGKFLTKYNLCKQLTELKQQQEFSWLQDISAQSLQQTIFILDKAFTSFFKHKNNFPKFKSRKRQQTYHLANKTYPIFEDNRTQIPKIGRVKTRFDRIFTGKVKSCTIKKTSTNKYFVCILVDDGLPNTIEQKKITKDRAIGIDLGLTNLITLSDSRKIKGIRPYKDLEEKIKRKQRKLAKKQKGSKNREKARLQLAKLYEKVNNRRRDFLHKITTQLVNESQIDVFCVETLSIQDMQKNHRLAKSISDVSWGTLVAMLESKANLKGKHVLKIGRFEPSTKLCTCGHINELSLSDRIWTCKYCGKTHDRDILAANNIKEFAFAKQNLIEYSYKDYARATSPEDA